jgi:Uma2 family endonuclease
MSVETRLMTADELLAMPDDGMKHELVRGELITMSSAGNVHGKIIWRIARSLGNYAADRNLGEIHFDTGFILTRNPDTVRVPDVPFVRAARELDDRGFYPGCPDIAVEVMSPTDRYTEVRQTVREYLQAGTPVVLVVDPDKGIAWSYTPEERQLTIDDALEASAVIPGWSLPLRDLFA